MSSFIIRRLTQHSLHNNLVQKQKQGNKLIIQPNKIIFETSNNINKSGIVKMKLTSYFNYAIQFQIKQPKQKYLSVKFSNNLLAPEQTIQLFVFYNRESDNININLNDEFAIVVEHIEVYSLIIPIYLRSAEQIHRIKLRNKRQSKKKQNLKSSKLKNNNRTIGQNRYAGVIYSAINNINQDNNNFSSYDRIQQFLYAYENIGNFMQTKKIKCQIFRGQKPITPQKYHQIISFNLTSQIMTKDMQKQEILKRYKTIKSEQGPNIRNFQSMILQWDQQRNQPQITYKNGLQKFLRQIRSFVIYYRFKKMNRILTIYKNLRQEQNVQQPQTKIIANKFCVMYRSAKKIRNQDQNKEDLQYEKQIQAKKKHDYYCRKINKILANKNEKNLGADFALFTLTPRLLPLDLQVPSIKKNTLFQIKPRIGFDNWVTLQQLIPYNHELMIYQKIEGLYKWQYHPNYKFNKMQKTRNRYSFKDEKSWDLNSTYQRNKVEKSITQQQRAQLCEQLSFRLWDNSSRYKNIVNSVNQTDCLGGYEQVMAQATVRQPILENSKSIFEFQIYKNQYIPYFQHPIPSSLYKNINQTHLPSLITQLTKLDITSLNQLSQTKRYTKLIQTITKQEHIQLTSSSQLQEQLQAAQQKQYRSNHKYTSIKKSKHNQKIIQIEDSSQVHQRILQNIEKIKDKKYIIGANKLSSYNKFIKKQQNKILY